MSFIVKDAYAAILIVTVLPGGGAALLTKRVLAVLSKPVGHFVIDIFLLAFVRHFFHWRMFPDVTDQYWRGMHGILVSSHVYIFGTAILTAFVPLGLCRERTTDMVGQYCPLHRPTGPLDGSRRTNTDRLLSPES